MQYASGKTRIAKQISGIIVEGTVRYASGKTKIATTLTNNILERERERRDLISLFCGGLSVETRLAPHFKRIICNDKQFYLIELYKSIQNGWLPPDSVTVEEYKYIKEHKDENPALTGFVGFGCSFGGKWFGGYGRHGTKDKHAAERSMCQESKSALVRDIGILKDAEFTCLDYRDVPLVDNAVIYADPPYRNKMAEYGLDSRFDSDEFWNYAREVSKNHAMYISELDAPDDFVPIWEKPVLRQMANCNAENFIATEKLFVHKDSDVLKHQ